MPAPRPPFVTHVMELLVPMGPVSARSMFGGWSLSLDGLTFALIAHDELYFKVDDQNRSAYAALDLPGFAPYADKPDRVMSYHTPPAEALEDSDSLMLWARDALDAARRAPPKRPRSKKSTR
jgi:DNA transformation protein and related proteins